MDIIEGKVKKIVKEINGSIIEFLVVDEKGRWIVVDLKQKDIIEFEHSDKEGLKNYFLEKKVIKEKNEVSELLDSLCKDVEEVDELGVFNYSVREYAENNKEKFSEKVYDFLIKSDVYWINASDVFSGPGSPKDYLICVEYDNLEIELYFPYQADAECDRDLFTDKEISDIQDVYIECKYFYVELY